MTSAFEISQAGLPQVVDIATLVGELLHEVMDRIGQRVFVFDRDETAARLSTLLRERNYIAFVAYVRGEPAGCVTVCPSYSLYAQGAFGIIPELYVRPQYRSLGIGAGLLASAGEFGSARGWTRLEVTTPPLPEFERTLSFYERHGFAVTGGRKLKCAL